jgi:hypothetical protein
MAIYQSSEILRGNGPQGRGPGTVCTWVNGNVTFASNITLSSATTDTIQLCFIPSNSYIVDFKCFLPAIGASLVMNLQDTLTSPTTYITSITAGAAGGVIGYSLPGAGASTILQFSPAGQWGVQYGATARSQGTSGNKVVVWTSGTLLEFAVTTSASATTGASALQMPFILCFAPTYDAGV